MPSIKQVKLLRFLEHCVLVFLIISVIACAWLSAVGKLGVYESYAAGGIVILITLLLFFIQGKLDSWLLVIMSQTNYDNEDAFTSLYERSPVAYFTVTTDGSVKNCNPAATNLLQGESSKMRGLDLFDFVQSDAETNPAVLKSKAAAGLTIKDVEVPITTIKGETVWVMLSVYPYRNQGQRLVTLVDVTEQKSVDTAKSEFVALATHQLRTPISAIRWNVELLQRNMKDTKTDDQDRYLVKIDRNVLRMINLINDFLSVSKLEMGTFAAKEEEINLTEFLSMIIDEFAEKIEEKQITLNRHDNPPQAIIKADSRLFHIIVSNLVSNAVKYLNPNGTLSLSYEMKGETVEIVVADNGIGIPETEVKKLFTKFFRASNAQTHQTEGTGLGLYVVKQSAELLGGSIAVESAKDKGARFVVNIPVKVVSIREIG